ncbi:MAG: hypothetical protein DRP78_04145 [Candidatus Omnitrophota bacterium]|nr:MAG: hypothetical protein DRP78_04145 [Candidatus Omnitrophota bacterium]
MSEKNIFTGAILCSIFWHIFCMQAVDIVCPELLKPSAFPYINFLGSIAEDPEPYSRCLDFGENEKISGVALKKKLKKQGLHIKKENVTIADFPLAEFSQKPVLKVEFGFNFEESFADVQIDREIERKIIYKPELPVYPAWAKAMCSNFKIRLKFLILSDGTVTDIEKLSSSGYPELDAVGIRYIRGWKFMPLPEDAQNNGQKCAIDLFFGI